MGTDLRLAQQIGAALLRIRQRRGLQQYVLADLAGITKGMLSDFERGKRCPAFPTLVKILKALDCDAKTFGHYFGPWFVVR
jgi:transcriptional regulator with XRE-family HTH domain